MRLLRFLQIHNQVSGCRRIHIINRRSISTINSGKPAVCIAGSGPAGFYTAQYLLKGGDRRVRIFSAHNNWWATPEVSLPLPYQRSAKVFLDFLRQGVKTMYYF